MTTNKHLIRASINKAYIATFLVSKSDKWGSVTLLATCLITVTKHLMRSNLRKEVGVLGLWGFVSAHTYEEKTGTSQQQEPKAAAAHTHLHLQSGNSNGC